jgi:diguanylate cyclase (GGDEF)-like protein
MAEIAVLIIEDKDQDRLTLERILVSHGFQCTFAPNAVSALKELKNKAFGVVIAESHISGTTAVDFTIAALGVVPHISVVFLTPAAFLAGAIDAMEQGAFGYITKPLNPKEVTVVAHRAHEFSVFRASGAQQEELTEMSVKDPLTGVFNRRFMDIFLRKKAEKGRATGDKFVVVMCDVDHFKKFNDTYGHQAGDKILKDMSQVFVEAIREHDAVFRYGGEEFMLYISGVDRKTGVQIADRIRNTACMYMPATVSMGLSAYPDDSFDPTELIAKADAALYHSKKNGRNQLTPFAEGMRSEEKK